MTLEQFPPLVQVILLGFSSVLLVLLALWYMLRLPSWLARRKKLALHRAIMQPRASTPDIARAKPSAPSPARQPSPATETQAIAKQKSPKPSFSSTVKSKPTRAAKGYADFKQQRQQDPSSKLSNDRFRGANARKRDEMKRMKATLVRQAKPKLPQQASDTAD